MLKNNLRTISFWNFCTLTSVVSFTAITNWENVVLKAIILYSPDSLQLWNFITQLRKSFSCMIMRLVKVFVQNAKNDFFFYFKNWKFEKAFFLSYQHNGNRIIFWNLNYGIFWFWFCPRETTIRILNQNEKWLQFVIQGDFSTRSHFILEKKLWPVK